MLPSVSSTWHLKSDVKSCLRIGSVKFLVDMISANLIERFSRSLVVGSDEVLEFGGEGEGRRMSRDEAIVDKIVPDAPKGLSS